MAFVGVKLDPDDPFDRVVFVEERLIQDGYDAGFVTGKERGEEDGFRVGLLKGKELGREIGFYKGFVSAMFTLAGDSAMRDKHRKLLEQLNSLLDSFSYSEHKYESMQYCLGQIRSKFKQLSSVFKLPVQLTKHDISF